MLHASGLLGVWWCVVHVAIAEDSAAHAREYRIAGIGHLEAGRFREAVDSLSQVVRLQPQRSVAYLNLGTAYQRAGDTDRAMHNTRRAAELEPTLPEAYYNLALTTMEEINGEEVAAERYARHALKLRPHYPEYHSLCATAAMYRQRFGDAVAMYSRSLALRRGRPYNRVGEQWWRLNDAAANGSGHDDQQSYWKRTKTSGLQLTTSHKMEHDIQQLSRLIEKGRLPARFRRSVSTIQSVLNQVRLPPPPPGQKQVIVDDASGDSVSVSVPKGGGYVSLTAAQVAALSDTWRRAPYVEPARSVLPERAVPARTASEISRLESEFFANDSIYFDNLLSPKALFRMREFCLESTVWHQEKSLGYVGSQLDDGFASPLLFQIAEELRSSLPRVFGKHKLRHAWAYKYDSTLQEGIDAHADQAAVNVNFWITPDEDNLKTEPAGLVIFKAVAPTHWDFEAFNNRGSSDRIADLIRKDGYRNTTVPYRQNRVVIFDSSLFHQTDRFRFRRGYTSRRINVTLLFGKRSESRVAARRGASSSSPAARHIQQQPNSNPRWFVNR